jgi:hypothetical protein
MTMATAPFNATASVTQFINQPLSVTVGPHRVHTEAPPPPSKMRRKTYAHAKRPNADAARRGAYKSLKDAGMLPQIMPDDIVKSQASQALCSAGFGARSTTTLSAFSKARWRRTRPSRRRSSQTESKVARRRKRRARGRRLIARPWSPS